MRAQSTLKSTVVAFALTIAVLTVAIIAWLASERSTAHADTRADAPAELALPAGRKLVDLSWRCYGDYPCRPYMLTRAMRKDETPETYGLSSPYGDAPETYVIKESR